MSVLILSGTSAMAQPPLPSPLARADLSGSVGWYNATLQDIEWYGRSLHGSATGGWYWTDHLKTEVEVGATSTARLYGSRAADFPGRPTSYTPIHFSVGTRKVTAVQLFQGFRNQWVHPYAGAGLDVTWARIRERHGPTVLYDPVRGFTELLPEQTVGPYVDRVIRPVAVAGLKAYVTPRVFVRGDLRVAFRGGVDEVLLRGGLGVDF